LFFFSALIGVTPTTCMIFGRTDVRLGVDFGLYAQFRIKAENGHFKGDIFQATLLNDGHEQKKYTYYRRR
jgi:hypothetical protein